MESVETAERLGRSLDFFSTFAISEEVKTPSKNLPRAFPVSIHSFL
ncbi:hypothetical protein [Methanosarcina siciliae]|nr:hypothetical protein [Methanosarcina siciliae]